jgi:hypothetical protein
VKKVTFIILTGLIISWQGLAQEAPPTFRVWQLTHYTGSVGLRGFYRDQKRTISNITDYSVYPTLYGNILLNTQSYLGHPNLLLLDIGGEYNPGLDQQTYTVSPDRSEVLTMAKLNTRATLFNSKPMSLSAYFDISRNFINREYVTSLRTDAKQWGLNYNFNNKILPFIASYSDRKWDQLETETGRTYRNRQKDLRATVKKSFTKYGDTNELNFIRYDYFTEDQNLVQVNNKYDNWLLNNIFYFDKKKRYSFRSYITNLNQTGTTLNQKRLQLFESVSLRLPYKLRFNGNYDFTNVDQQTQGYRQQRIKFSLDHELFTSLRSGVYYESFNTNHSSFKETNTRTGISFGYIKKIPAGTLNLGYSLNRHNQNVVSNPGSDIQIFDEPHVLIDGEVILLDLPYIDLATVVVKDNTGSFIYQRDFDYLLVERNEFVEIVRVPGGQIPNNGAVLVDYVAAQIGSYNFTANLQSFSIRVTLFQRLLELYYTKSIQDYYNVEAADFVTLNYFTRNIYGTRLQILFFNLGVEKDEYNSTIVPYDKMRYFLQMNGKVGKKVLLSLNGDYTDLVLTETNTRQLYSSIFGKVVYQIRPRSKLDLDIGYRKQVGDEIDLDLITAKLEFNTVYRNLYMKVGLEVYSRDYVGEVFNFRGIYFQVDRKF